MKKYDVLIKEYDYLVIAINTVYNTSEIIDDVESDLQEYKFNGYYIFDFLLKCVNIDSIDRLIAYKVIDGNVSYKEKYLIMENKHQVIKHMNDYYSNIDVKLIKSSLLSDKSKLQLRNKSTESK